MDERDEVNEDEVAAEPQEPSTPILERLVDPIAALLACLALLVALYPAWGKGWMPIRGDALNYFWPLREALGAALQQGTLPLYELTNNGGTPLWLNPQTQALYPPARLYGMLPVGEAMGFLHAAHLLLLFAGTVALLRRLSYRYATASLAALCVALGGAFLSASAMQDKAQTGAWLPLMLWGALSIHERSILPRLVLAGATAMAVLAGGLDIVVIGICATILAASVAAVSEPEIDTEPDEPEPEGQEGGDGFGLGGGLGEEEETDFVPLMTGGDEGTPEEGEEAAAERPPSMFSELPDRLSEAGRHCLKAGLWVLLGLGLCATQWLPFRLWIETSDWGAQMEAAELSARSLRLADLLGLLAPNLPYDAAAGEYRLPGIPGAQPVYLPGLYAGGAAVLLTGIGFIATAHRQFSQPRTRWLLPGPVAAATLGSLLCLALAAGPAIPPLSWLQTHLPILSSIRYPEKWLLLGALLAAVPIADGARHLAAPRTSTRLLLQIGGGVLAVVLVAAGIGMTAGEGDLGRGMSLLAAAGMAGLLTCAAWRLLSLRAQPGLAVLGVSLAILITVIDLGVHNLPLAPLLPPSEIVTPPVAAQRLLRSADKQRRSSGTMLERRARLHQASYAMHDKDPVTPEEAPLHQVLRESLMGGIPSVWGIEVMRDWLVMAPSGLEKWYRSLDKLALARQFDGLRLAGVTHIVVHFRDDVLELLPLVGKGLEEVYTPEGSWTQVAIFALTAPLPSCRWTPLGVPAADGLPIVPDEDNHGTWRGRVTAGNGLVVCLRPWDPAWHVEVDGKPVDTQIANGFQLALPVGPGAHEVVMEYRPRGLWLASQLRTLSLGCLLVWAGLRVMRKRKNGDAEPEPETDATLPAADEAEEQSPY